MNVVFMNSLLSKHLDRKVVTFESLVVVLVGVVVAVVYHLYDPREMLDYEIFPWDSRSYYRVAREFEQWPPSFPLTEIYPYGPRLVWPFLVGITALIASISLSQSAFLVGTAVSIGVGLTAFHLWRRSGVQRQLAYLGLVLFFVTSAGPLRSSGVYPGGGAAVEMATMLLIYWALVRSRKQTTFAFTGALAAAFIAALSREFVVIVAVVAFAISLSGNLIKSQSTVARHFLLNQENIQSVNLSLRYALISTSSLMGSLLARQAVKDDGGGYSTLQTIIDYSYFRLNAFEFFYPYLIALGPIFLVVVLCYSKKSLRKEFVGVIKQKVVHLDLAVLVMAVSVLFAVVGGTDSERFLMWGWPFFALVGLHGVQVLVRQWKRVRTVLLILVLVTLAWSRFYVPAAPHIFFPGENYCSWAGVKTNYDPTLYRGVPGLSLLREDLAEVPPADLFSPDEIVLNKDGGSTTAIIPATQSRDTCKDRKILVLRGAYKFNINHVPVPFGFPHNHYELLAAHSFHGSLRVRLLITLQWVAVGVLVVFLVRRNTSSLR